MPAPDFARAPVRAADLLRWGRRRFRDFFEAGVELAHRLPVLFRRRDGLPAGVPLTVMSVTLRAEMGGGKSLPDAARPRGKDHVREPSVRRPRPGRRARRARGPRTALRGAARRR